MIKQALLSLTILSGAAFAAAPASPFPAVPGEENIKFDREAMWSSGDWFSEGEFRTKVTPTICGAEECYLKEKNLYAAKITALKKEAGKPYPFTRAPWPGQKEFLTKLKLIEYAARNQEYLGHKGFETGSDCSSVTSPITREELSGGRLWDKHHKIQWRPGYRTHYLEKHCVLPSRHFYRYVHARAAELGAKTFVDAEKALADIKVTLIGAYTADGMLPWNDPLQQQRIVDSLAPLVPALDQYGDLPYGWAEKALPQAKMLCPELTGKNGYRWVDRLRRDRALTRKHKGLSDLMYEFWSEHQDQMIAAWKQKEQFAVLYQDYK